MFKKSPSLYGFLVALFLGISSFAQSSETVPELIEKTRPSVVTIVTYDKNGKRLSRGTGFIVASNRVITNYHVIDNAFRTEIQNSDRKTYRVTSIDSTGKNGDLALLQTEQIEPTVKPLYVAAIMPRVGDKVLVIGNPLGLTGSVSDGIVSAFRIIRGVGKLIQITAPISPGSSGSPVINMSGEVIGVATLNLENGQNLNFAISSETIRDLWSTILSTARNSPSATSQKSERWRALLSEDITWDTETATNNNGVISTWIQYKEDDGGYEKVLTEINCNTSQIRNVRSLSFNSNGDVVRQIDRPNTWTGLVPDSNGEAYFKIFCKDQPDSQYIKDWYRKKDLIESAGKLMDSKNYDEAINVYSKLIQEFSESAAFGFARIGVAKEAQGKLREAKNSFLEAIKLEPTDYYYRLLGEVFEKEENTPAAIDAYWKSLYLDKQYRFSKWNLMKIYLKTKNFAGLTKLYKFLISQGEINNYDELGDAYEKQGLRTLAQSTRTRGVKVIEQSIRVGKADAVSYLSVAALYKSLNNPTKVQMALAAGVDKFPKDSFLTMSLAENYNEHKRWSDAVRIIKNGLHYTEDNFYKKRLLTALKTSYLGLNKTADAALVEQQLSELE